MQTWPHTLNRLINILTALTTSRSDKTRRALCNMPSEWHIIRHTCTHESRDNTQVSHRGLTSYHTAATDAGVLPLASQERRQREKQYYYDRKQPLGRQTGFFRVVLFKGESQWRVIVQSSTVFLFFLLAQTGQDFRFGPAEIDAKNTFNHCISMYTYVSLFSTNS